MKLIWIVIGMVMMSTCEQRQSTLESQIKSITYSAMTRGSSFTCTIDEHKIQLKSDGTESYEKSKEITSDQWMLVLENLEGISLESLDKLDAPSDESAADRARIASLVVHSTTEIYESIPFDEGNPPKVLSPLINNILALAQTVD
jgi:hypothetical protein